VAKGVDTVQFDAWNKEREAYSSTYAQNAGYGGPNHGYGLQDLNYYGDYFYASGYGYAWQPYGFANSMLGWDPYSNGAWMFYPGLGYSWASAYPWGWLPYHYGSWAYINGAGWAWLPGSHYGGQWYANNFQNVPTVVKAPAGWTAATPPAMTATNSSRSTVIVGKQSGAPAYIPGGRIPPSFGSVIAGRTAAANSTHGFVSPNAGNSGGRYGALAASDQRAAVVHHSSAHVFAVPAPHAAFSGPIFSGPNYGSTAGGGQMGASQVASAHSSSASSHSSSASHK
jgi:hypothetical protein